MKKAVLMVLAVVLCSCAPDRPHTFRRFEVRCGESVDTVVGSITRRGDSYWFNTPSGIVVGVTGPCRFEELP